VKRPRPPRCVGRARKGVWSEFRGFDREPGLDRLGLLVQGSGAGLGPRETAPRPGSELHRSALGGLPVTFFRAAACAFSRCASLR